MQTLSHALQKLDGLNLKTAEGNSYNFSATRLFATRDFPGNTNGCSTVRVRANSRAALTATFTGSTSSMTCRAMAQGGGAWGPWLTSLSCSYMSQQPVGRSRLGDGCHLVGKQETKRTSLGTGPVICSYRFVPGDCPVLAMGKSASFMVCFCFHFVSSVPSHSVEDALQGSQSLPQISNYLFITN